MSLRAPSRISRHPHKVVIVKVCSQYWTRVHSDETPGAALRLYCALNARWGGSCKRLPYHFCHGLPTDTASLAVLGPEPRFQQLCTFAGIAGTTAKRNILSGDYPSVIHDVFPAWAVSRASTRQSELDAAIDTRDVPADNLPLKRVMYVPTVQVFSPVTLTANQLARRRAVPSSSRQRSIPPVGTGLDEMIR